jgi:hypothetical protein
VVEDPLETKELARNLDWVIDLTAFNRERVLSWGIIQAILCVCWYVEDTMLEKARSLTAYAERLILRPPQLGDEKPLNQAINRSLPELQRWMPWANDPSMQPTINFVKQSIISWVADAPRDFPMVIIHKKSQHII